MPGFEKLVEVRKVTEWRAGAIYKTTSLGERWVPLGTDMYKPNEAGEFYCSLSTDRMRKVGDTIRRVKP